MGFGDDIMATADARELKQAMPHAAVLIGDGDTEYFSPVFENNPHISRRSLVLPSQPVVWLKNYPGHRPYIDYARSDMDRKQTFTDYRARPGDLFLDERLIAAARERIPKLTSGTRPRVYLEPHVDFGPNKDWGFKNWQAVGNELARVADVFQPIYDGKRALENVLAFESASFLEACAVLSECHVFVGPEGGMHHAAAALRRRGVVVFGGRIHPQITGYATHINLYWNDRNDPCGMIEDCDHCQICLTNIAVEDVLTAARIQLNKATAHP